MVNVYLSSIIFGEFLGNYLQNFMFLYVSPNHVLPSLFPRTIYVSIIDLNPRWAIVTSLCLQFYILFSITDTLNPSYFCLF